MAAKFRTGIVLTGLLGALASPLGFAQSVTILSEDFTRDSTPDNWYYFGGACLTARTAAGTGTVGVLPGQIPGCMSLLSSYYQTRQDGDPILVGGYYGQLPDPDIAQTSPPTSGDGALRFTNGRPYGHFESGAIVSAVPFNAGNGVQVVFKTVTYRGDSGGAGGDGADGMSFYLLDATLSTPGDGLWNGIGSTGGSLAYTCSNANYPYPGVTAGYIGLGMDEYGNFLNGQTLAPNAAALLTADARAGNTNTGIGSATGDNTASGYGYWPGRIGLRGQGSVNWPWLSTMWSTYYPSSVLNTPALQAAAVQATCKAGTILDYRRSPAVAVTNPVSTPPGLTFYDYAPVASATGITNPAFRPLPSGTLIANESANTRPDGVTTQNVFLYNLKITQDGLLSFSYSMNGGAFQQVVTSQSITSSNGPLPKQLYFGFAGSTGGDTNIHEILCFKATPVNQSATSAAGNQRQTATVQAGTQAYFAYYNPNDWTGTVSAYTILDNAGTLTIASSASWDAQCLLSGIAAGSTCLSTGVTGPTSPSPLPTNRVMLTWNGLDTAASPGNAGLRFEFANLTAAEQTVIDAGDATPSANRVNYLRGDRTNEINSAGVGLYRARDGVLGDIVDSSPVWVGPPNSPYSQNWRDNLNSSTTMPENGGQAYTTFVSNEQNRLNVVYVGANDGFLHGFRSGTENINGVVSSTNNDGQEVLAYMPGAILNTIHNATNASLDYSNTQYQHNFFVDATPGTGDLYYQGAWHTWLVGGLGAGGSAIYALDITDPQASGTLFSESNASDVKFEVSSATINCQNVASCGTSLGNTYGTPQIRRLHNGYWGAIFGNGFGSTTGDAGIFVMVFNTGTGGASAPTAQYYYLSTGVRGSNGIAYVTTADLDGDHITDYVYAGDLLGNVWRFDLTSQNPSNWAVTSGGPLFTTSTTAVVNGRSVSVPQPITSAVTVAGVASSANAIPQVIIGFGTGQRTQFTNSSATTYSNYTQTLYGVWDWNFSAWNALPGQGATYASLTAAQMRSASGNSNSTLTPANLQAQTFSFQNGNIATSNNTITYATSCSGSGRCTGGFGWKANLIATNGDSNSIGAITEQVVAPVGLYAGAMIFNSVVPASPNLLSCDTPQTDTGFTYVLNVLTGGTFNFGTAAAPHLQSAFTNYKDTSLVGLSLNETGSGSVLNTVEGTTFVLGQSIAPTAGQPAPQPTQITLPNNVVSNRQTWVQLR